MRRLTVTEAEALVASVRAGHRERLERLREVARDQARVEAELFPPPPEGPSLWDRLWASLGRRTPDAEADELERLEEQIAVGQRLLVRLAHHLDLLHLDRSSQEARRREHLALAEAAAAEAARLEATGAHAQAVREARVAARLHRVVQLHDQVLAVDARITEGVAVLHAAAAEALDAVDDQLARAAAEARARDMARLLGDGGPLHEAVVRVRRLAGEGRIVVDEGLDRLATEVDLLAPADPDALAAEAEVAAFLRGQ